MKAYLPIIPFIGALALISCGGGGDPVADNAESPPANVVGDVAATGTAAPANAAAAAAHDAAALPGATDGMRWSAAPDGKSVTYGGASGARMLSIACTNGQIIVTRHAGAPSDGNGTLSLTGGGHVASLPMVSRRSADGSHEWSGTAAGDIARAIARTLGSNGPVQITLGGAPSLVVDGNQGALAPMRACGVA